MSIHRDKVHPRLKRKTQYMQVRVTAAEKSRIKTLANIYAEGNLSLWVVNASLHMDREFLKDPKKKRP